MSPRLVGGLVASHTAVFAVTSLITYRLAKHLRWSANPTGWWWE